ncbi:PEP-CTERM sorting domain-containing protein [Mariniblastus sp.]|nr:PEP-CTERM sorting domain-containing protein [Mariniblastus sp.]
MSSRFLLSFLAVIAISHVSVAKAQVFPTSFQASIDNGDFTEPVFVLSSPSFQRYDYFDTSNDTRMHLLRYSMRDDSGNEFTRLMETDGTDGSITTRTQFSGSAWLSLQNEYDLSSNFDRITHQMTLYTEQAVPSQFPAVEDVTLTLSTDALLAGTGSFFSNIDGTEVQNNGLDSDGPLVCLAPGCFTGAEFNLLNVSYREVGDVARAEFLLPPVEGQLLYSEFTGFPGFGSDGSEAFDSRSNFIVGSVPEPGSGMILFLSAALTLSLRRKRR